MLDLDNNAVLCYQKKLDNAKKHKHDQDLDNACKEYLKEKNPKKVDKKLNK